MATPTNGDDFLDGTDNPDSINGLGGSDVINGFGGNDTLIGGAGEDFIFGGDGNDFIVGGLDDDELYGEAGNDTLRGGAGDDRLFGGQGNDNLSGGRGADSFVYDDADSGNDLIRDFDPDEDTLDLLSVTGLSPDNIKIEKVNGGTLISSTDKSAFSGTILLRGVDPDDLNSENLLVPCFVRGTMIRTPAGEVPVETLAIGDLVSTLAGVDRPVKWIGRRSFKRRFIGRNSEANPVLIRQGALGPNMPDRDLAVSGKHAMYFDGVFVRAEDLVNGDTIVRDVDLDLIEYFHVELETPDVIFSNGAPTETFANHNSRRMFVNWREYVDLYGSEDAIEPKADGEFERPFPLVTGGQELAAVLESLPAPRELRKAA